MIETNILNFLFQNMQKSIDSNDTSNSGLSATATATPTNENADETNENGSGSIKDEQSSNGTGNENGNGNANVGDQTRLNLKMSAKELRAKLAMRKKYDPKKESLDFKDKFDIVQKL